MFLQNAVRGVYKKWLHLALESHRSSVDGTIVTATGRVVPYSLDVLHRKERLRYYLTADGRVTEVDMERLGHCIERIFQS